LRIVRRLAVALAVLVPFGFLAYTQAGAVGFPVTTTITGTQGGLASPQPNGDENWSVVYTATVTGGGYDGNFPEGYVTFNAGTTSPGTAAICRSNDFTSGAGGTGTNDTLTAGSVDTVTYGCTGPTDAALEGPGTYHVYATFTGDTPDSALANFVNSSPVTTGSLATVVIDAVNATPGITTTFSGTGAGTEVTDEADITTGAPGTNGPTYNPAATVTFQQFTSNTCTTPINSPATESVGEDSGLGNTNDGDATSPDITVPATTGTSEYFDAVYNGNSFNDAATSSCETLTATAAVTSITTTATTTGTVGGAPLTDQVTISGVTGTLSPSESVLLEFETGSTCTGTIVYTWTLPLNDVVDGSQTWTVQETPTVAGNYSWASSYGGDVNNAPSSDCETTTVNPAPTPPVPPVPTNGPLSITTHFLPGGMHGRSYAEYVVAHGGTPPLTWSISLGALPPGLHINSATGLISGTLGATGTYYFTVTVTDSTAAPTGPLTASQAYRVTIT
jgi:hypothetical protein